MKCANLLQNYLMEQQVAAEWKFSQCTLNINSITHYTLVLTDLLWLLRSSHALNHKM